MSQTYQGFQILYLGIVCGNRNKSDGLRTFNCFQRSFGQIIMIWSQNLKTFENIPELVNLHKRD